jgi:hypothetical protein
MSDENRKRHLDIDEQDVLLGAHRKSVRVVAALPERCLHPSEQCKMVTDTFLWCPICGSLFSYVSQVWMLSERAGWDKDRSEVKS